MSHCLPQQQTTTPWSAFAHDLRHVLKNFYRQLTSIRWSFTPIGIATPQSASAQRHRPANEGRNAYQRPQDLE